MSNKNRLTSKIINYGLEQDTINLRKAGLTYQGIADELNASGKIPANDQVNADIVSRFLNHLPELKKEVMKRDANRMLNVVDNSIDIISEMSTLYGKAKIIMDSLEKRALDNDKVLDPYRFKALSSEMREMLKQMTEMQKDLHDHNNTRIFMQTVMDVVQEVSPESLPIIINRLKMDKPSLMFGNTVDSDVK